MPVRAWEFESPREHIWRLAADWLAGGISRKSHDQRQLIVIYLLAQLKLLLSPPPGNGLWVFWNYANLMRSGQLPYFHFVPEYPPLAMALFYLPYLFTNEPLFYALVFKFFILITILIGALIIWLWGKNMGKIWLYLFLLFLIQSSEYKLLFERFDIFVAVTTLLSLYVFFQRKNERLGWFILFLAMMIKVYPLVLVPIFFFKGKHKWRILWFFVPLVISNGYIWNASHGQYVQFLQMQWFRPPEAESVIASMMFAWHFLTGASIPTVYAMNSWSVNVPLHLFHAFRGIVVALTVVPLIVAIQKIKTYQPVRLAVIAITAFLLMNNVFSAQFLVWLMIFIPFLDLTEVSIFTIVTFLTAWVFVFYNDFWSGKPINDFVVFLLLTKNILFYVFYLKLLWGNLRTSLPSIAFRPHARRTRG